MFIDIITKMGNIALVVIAVILELSREICADRKLLLSDIHTLTLYNGKMTNARRSSPIPQVKCVGGTAGCDSFRPQVIQCYNKGSDGYDVQWECKTDMDNLYRFGRIQVSCEGYDYRDDPFILRGSCGLEYHLDLTEAGYKRRGQHGGSFYGGKSYGSSYSGYYKNLNKGSSIVGDVIMLLIVGLIIYAIYKTCIANQHEYRFDGHSPHADDMYPPGFGPSAPPPPGFRPEYMPSGGCHGGYQQGYQNRQHNDESAFGGFWTGAAMGGLAGYMFGNSGTSGNTRRHGGSSWGSTGSWSSESYSDSGWGDIGGSESSRSASGFGGTERR